MALAMAYIIEVVLEGVRDSFTLTRVVWLLACIFYLCMFIVEIVYIFRQEPTINVLNQSSDVIDARSFVDNYQTLYYVQAINLILLISFRRVVLEYQRGGVTILPVGFPFASTSATSAILTFTSLS